MAWALVRRKEISASMAFLQANGKPLRQSRGKYFFLCALNVVRYAIKSHERSIGVINQERRSRIAIAWLPYRSGIHHVIRLRLYLQPGSLFALGRLVVWSK